jgi:fructokinase
VILGEDHAIQRRVRVATERERGYEWIVARIGAVVTDLLADAPECDVVGVGTPGSVSRRTGTLKNSNTICLNGRPLAADLEAHLGMPVRLENDANCFALAEALLGAGRGHEVVFGVILGTGVGGGIVLGGRLWSGPQDIAGEWGITSWIRRGRSATAARAAASRRCSPAPRWRRSTWPRAARRATRRPWPCVPRRATSARRASSSAGSTASAAGSRTSCNILDPSVVVLGGGLSNIAALYGRGREAVARRVFNDELTTPIVQNTLGDSAGVIGAALLAAASGRARRGT